MARKQRRLFPALTATYQTGDCELYNCEPFPDYYYFPPLPPPPSSLSVAHHSKSPYLIISLSFLAVVLVLVGYYVFIEWSCSSWCSRRNNGPAPSQSGGTGQEFLDDTQVDHPIWFITTVGLQQSVISSITVCKYKKDEGLIEGTKCSVCLNEFQEDETLRLLPKCNHAFHVPGIDTWLRSHNNCPLCRANIVTATVSLDIVRHPFASADQSANNLDINEGTHMTNFGNDYQVSNRDMSENRAGTADEGELPVVNGERISKEGANCGGNHAFRIVLGHSMDNYQDVDNGMRVRRNVSMDSSGATSNCHGLANFILLSLKEAQLIKLKMLKSPTRYCIDERW